MKTVADLLTALAALAWPVVVGGAIWMFRSQIGQILAQLGRLLARMKRWKGLGQEIELDKQLDDFQQKTAAAVEEVARIPASTDHQPKANQPDVIENIIAEAGPYPLLALIHLAQEIEREVSEIMASTGWGPTERITSLQGSLAYLQEIKALPSSLAGSIDAFYRVRNQLVHKPSTIDAEALRALDIGIELLKALKAIQRDTHVVEETEIPLFSSQELRSRLAGFGIVLKTTGANGVPERHRIFPTAQTHFVKGKRVAWEWNYDRMWRDAWYLDRVSGRPQLAFAVSPEFVGRHLD